MIRQVINVRHYWKVIVYYNIDYDFWHIVQRDIDNYTPPVERNVVKQSMQSFAKAFTISNTSKHISIVGFNKHDDELDYINSIVHEAEHIKQAMLKAYNIDESGEPPANTVAYLVEKMLQVFII